MLAGFKRCFSLQPAPLYITAVIDPYLERLCRECNARAAEFSDDSGDDNEPIDPMEAKARIAEAVAVAAGRA